MTPQIENIKHPLLREFAENAQHKSIGDFGMTIYGGVNLTAYAELIVRECAQFVEDKFDFCGDEIIIAEEVRKHFGVEE
jgi:hypothetical protein